MWCSAAIAINWKLIIDFELKLLVARPAKSNYTFFGILYNQLLFIEKNNRNCNAKKKKKIVLLSMQLYFTLIIFLPHLQLHLIS